MNAGIAAVETRIRELGLEFMAAGLESFLESRTRQDNTLAQSLADLSSLSFVPRKENLILMGPSGLGKTHLMLALAHKACLTGHTVWGTPSASTSWKTSVVHGSMGG